MKILIIGGNRFFGKRLTRRLIDQGNSVSLLNRQNSDDGFGSAVTRMKCDRKDQHALANVLAKSKWDLVYDQVCYETQDARNAVDIFKDKTDRYIFTSSQSVYGLGSDLTEGHFDPKSHHFESDVSSTTDYAEAKRQCEAVFFSQNHMNVTAVRFPIVVGLDDYTGRLKWHVEHIKRCQPMFFPALDARMAIINSSDASHALFQLSQITESGPVNVCSPSPLKLRDLISEVENATRTRAILASESSHGSHSPYGIEGDWYMDSAKSKKLGIHTSDVKEWLPQLVRELAQQN